MKEDINKSNMEVALKTPETVNPFRMMRRFTKDMERLFEDFQGFSFPTFFTADFPPFRMDLEKGKWMPQLDVLKNNGKLTVRADLPGLTKDNVKIEITDDFLTISGERKEEQEEKREGFYRSERSYGSFYRQIPLPEGAQTENAAATFANGVLEITIPAPEVATATRQIEITEPKDEKSIKAAA